MIEELQALGVRRVAPTHCTGEPAIAQFRAAFADNFIEAGAGAVILSDSITETYACYRSDTMSRVHHER